MAKDPPQTVGDLRHRSIVTDDEIAAAVDTFLTDPKLNAFQFASGHFLDVAAAVAGHATASTVLADPNAELPFRRTMIRTAVIVAVPVKG